MSFNDAIIFFNSSPYILMYFLSSLYIILIWFNFKRKISFEF
ncbi:316R [Invertebrate iridescent virus Kaz2018]|uniref:316R n=1 Tax=Invertebrate iridescent virus 6 TaxID=176652 RepID=Q91FK8_IIV6|nr:316R [Invertebrate iridescent virus 6]AAK82177.1 316R [Invertebrate iridescent virus 6]QMS79746.1 hypothetical protein IIV6-T1_309 [Invertebrate iridescent virus 6]QNH08726.1 316R [Invertebrate iridescent virus Kaz2018]